VAVVGSMPSVGLYFGIYSFCKKTFQQLDHENYEQRQTLYIALSAAIGNTIASASRVPYEVVKQKLQTKAYASMADAMRDLSLKTLFPTGGIASQMLRDIPYAIVTLMTYEHLKSVWKTRAENRFPRVPVKSWDLLVGGISGGVGSYVTNPMDVIKTRLQTDSEFYSGSIRTCAKLTLEEGGPAAFLRGSVPRLLHKVPANAFFFFFYEFFRSVLRVQDDVPSDTRKTARR
jgi:solute carrier family 25 S-adenosylmethionine transporter 26